VSDPDATPRRRLPDVALAPAAGGHAVPLRRPRHAVVLVLLGGAPDDDARDFLRRLAGAEPSIAGWDGRVLVVATGGGAGGPGAAAAGGSALPFPVLADPAGAVVAAAGVDPPAVVVADQWGEVYWSSGAWPRVEELADWARFLAIRCAG
jgi:hypothetical protein